MTKTKRTLACILSLALVLTCLTLPGGGITASADETDSETESSEVLTYEYEGHTFSYEEAEDAVTITGCTDTAAETTVTDLTIPDAIDDVSVTAIGEDAFSGYTALETITLPDTVTEIGSSAFSGCTALASIELPDALTELGSSAFNECSALTSIDLPDGLTKIASKTFMNCTGLKTVDFPDSLVTINSYAFYGCQSIEEIYFPDALTTIYAYAFYNCTEITYVLLPADTLTIGENNFGQSTKVETIEYAEGCERPYTGDTWETDGCFIGAAATLILPSSITSIDTGNSGYTEDLVNNYYMDFASLTNIVIPEDNEYFSVYDGCIYDKDQTTLYICAHGKTSIEFPDTVTTISAGAFANCENITEVVFPDTVTTIEGTEATSSRNSYGAFRSCGALTKITVPSSVTFIGEQAFISCDALTDISFYLDGVYYHFSGDGGLTQLEIGEGSASQIDITDEVFGLFGTAYKQAASYMTEETDMQEDIETVIVPSAADSISPDLFDDMSALTEIEVSGEDGSYFSYNGVLYQTTDASAGTSTLIRYPQAQNYVELADGVSVIGEKAFYYCRGIDTVDLPSTITEVEKQAFYYFMDSTVTFSEGLTSIGDEAFYGCLNTTVYLPESLTSIGTDAFYTLDNSLTLMCIAGSYAASYAEENSLTYDFYEYTEETDDAEESGDTEESGESSSDEGGTSGDGSADGGSGSDTSDESSDAGSTDDGSSSDDSGATDGSSSSGDSSSSDDSGATGGTGSAGSSTSGNASTGSDSSASASSGADVGTKVTIGNAVYKVTSATAVTYVKSMKNVSKVTIPATVRINGKSYKVTAVSASAFAKNTKLKTVVIGKNVTTIGKKAFYNCKKLKKITFKGKKVKSIGAKAFKGTAKKAFVKVPKAKKAAYKKLLKKAGLSAKATVK